MEIEKKLIIKGFIGRDGQESVWSVQMKTSGDSVTIALHWADKVIPTHATQLELKTFKKAVSDL